jgi:hypothetical protein
VGKTIDSVEDIRNAVFQRLASVLVIVFRQPGANIIATVDRVRASCRSSGRYSAGDQLTVSLIKRR